VFTRSPLFHYFFLLFVREPSDAFGEPAAMPTRGVRGATTVAANDREQILAATRQLLALIIRYNGIDPRDVASAMFTTTADVDAEFPALAARQLGWLDVPLMCGHEMSVPGSLPRCIRVLIHWNTEKTQQEIEHVYIREAKRLRPDLINLPAVDWEELEQWIAEQMDH
jgi:chorismate mutase